MFSFFFFSFLFFFFARFPISIRVLLVTQIHLHVLTHTSKTLSQVQLSAMHAFVWYMYYCEPTQSPHSSKTILAQRSPEKRIQEILNDTDHSEALVALNSSHFYNNSR
ncbi:hypothetical protein V8C40DRAFT_228806 [Trichoderma camerunense]